MGMEFTDDAARRILREQVKKLGTHRAVAAKLEVAESQVSKWLKKAPMSRGTIHNILATFDPQYWNRKVKP